MTPFFAIDSDLLKNIVFVVVAVLAWAVKVAVERKEARGRGPSPRPDEEGGAPAPRQRVRHEEIDVVIEKRPLAPSLRPKPRRKPTRRSSVPAEPPVRPRVATKRVPATARSRALGGLEDRELKPGVSDEPSFDHDARPMDRAQRSRRRTLTRLGVPPGRSARDMLRAGVLWSEVLGVPRGVSGPHRPLAVRRRRP